MVTIAIKGMTMEEVLAINEARRQIELQIDNEAANDGQAIRDFHRVAVTRRRHKGRKPLCRPVNGPPVPYALRHAS